MDETNNNMVSSRRVCTEEMVAEVMADLIAEGNVSRADGRTPTIASISARIFERYDGLTPSASTLTRMRDKIMAARVPVSSEQIKATPATLPIELMNVLDQHARQEQVMLGQLANALADVLQRTSDELSGKLRVAVEQTKQEASQSAAVAEEEVAAALAQNSQLREQVARLTVERDTARSESAAERARSATFEQINTALLARLATTNAPVCADQLVAVVEHDQTTGLQTAPTTESSVDGTPIAGEKTEIRKPRKGRPRATMSAIEKEAA